MTDIEYIPAAPVIVEFRTKTLAVIDRDPASYITSSVRVAVVTRGGAKFRFYQRHKILQTRQMALTPSLGERRASGNLKKPSSVFVVFHGFRRYLTRARMETACIRSFIIDAFYDIHFALRS